MFLRPWFVFCQFSKTTPMHNLHDKTVMKLNVMSRLTSQICLLLHYILSYIILSHSKLISCFSSWEVASNLHRLAGKLQTQETITHHKLNNSCKAPTGTCRQSQKIIQYESLANGFSCTTTEQYGVNCARIEALVPHVHVVMTAVGPVVLLRTVMVCVVSGTRKRLPWTMWLCSEEHMFAKEVE